MSMITAFEFQDLIAFGVSSCQPNGRHYCFRSRTHEPDLLNQVIMCKDEFRQLIFKGRWRSKAHSILDSLSNFLADSGIIMSKNKWAPGSAEIYELISVGIPHTTAVATLDE